MICPDCNGNDPQCFRCGGEGELCDVCGQVTPDKPTPMPGSEARAIYLELTSKSPAKQLNDEKQTDEVRK